MHDRKQIRRLIKRDAKMLLLRRPGQFFFVTVIVLLGEFFNLSTITSNKAGYFGGHLLLMLLSFAIIAPLRMGFATWLLQTIRHRYPDVSVLFSWFNKRRFLCALMTVGFFYLALFLVILFTAVMACFILGAGILLGFFKWWEWIRFLETFDFSNIFNFSMGWIPHMMAVRLGFLISVISICAVLVLCIYFIYMIKYKAIYNIIIDKPDLRISDALGDSVDVMENRTWDMVVFYLSFIPWFLIVVLTFGLALLFVFPYVTASRILYMEYFRDMYHKAHDYETPSLNVNYLKDGDRDEGSDGSDDFKQTQE